MKELSISTDRPMRVLRFPDALAHEPSIDIWLNKQPAEFRTIARRWFEEMRACGDDVRELMHDGSPTACIQDAAFGNVSVFKAHLNVGLFNGAVLEDPAGLMEGSGKFMRHVKVRPGTEPDPSALGALIMAAYRDMKARL